MELINEGAEGKLYLLNSDVLLKIRTEKTYRLPVIDKKLRKQRNLREYKVLEKLFLNGVNVPKPLIVNNTDFSFQMEYLKGVNLKEILNEKLLFEIFNEIIKMHKLNIVHHDLTTLNMLYYLNKVYLIDFGLSQFSSKIEDKAVDLNLFLTCIKNEHPEFYFLKDNLLNLYKEKLDFGERVLVRLENIEKRGRNK